MEAVFLDDVFHDSSLMLELIKARSGEGVVEAWKELASSITNCPIAKRKIRCISLPGKEGLKSIFFA